MSIRGLKTDVVLLQGLFFGLFFALSTGWYNSSHHRGVFSPWAHHTPAYLFCFQLFEGAVMGTGMYLWFAAIEHLPHSGRSWWRVLLFLVAKLGVALVAFAAASDVVLAWLR